MTLFLIAAFLASGAQAAYAVLGDGTDAAAGVGTTGAQQALGTCPTPRITGLPKQPKFTNATIHVKLVGLTKGAAYLIKAGRIEVYSQLADGPTAKFAFQMPDQGTKSRKIPIQAIVASDQCENSPWKVSKKMRFKAVAPAPTPTPTATTPAPTAQKPATPTPTPATANPIKPAKPVQILPKLQEAPKLDIRTWITPIDGGARADKPLPKVKVLRRDQPKQKARSATALVGLGGLFLVVAVSAIGGLWFLKRRDDYSLEEAMGKLPQHLEEGSPDLQPDEEPGAVPLTAALSAIGESAAPEAATAALPIAAVQPEAAPPPVPGNGVHSPTENRAQVEAELQRMLSEVGIEAGLEGILSDARAEAERQGISIDPDLMLGALCDELTGSATLSEPARAQLRSKFQEIIAEEAQQVPQHSS